MPRPKTEGTDALTLQRERQAKYQAKLDAMSPLQVLRWKLARLDPTSVDERPVYTQVEEGKLASLRQLIAAAEVLAGEVNHSVIARLERTKMTPEVGAMLVELRTKKVRYTLPSY